MTNTPTDKKLSERFAMAAFAPGLVERGRAIGKIRDEVAAALSELAKLRGEAEWRPIEPIESVPTSGEFLTLSNDRRFITHFAAKSFHNPPFAGCPLGPTDEHRPSRPGWWRPLPSPPKDPAHD